MRSYARVVGLDEDAWVGRFMSGLPAKRPAQRRRRKLDRIRRKRQQGPRKMLPAPMSACAGQASPFCSSCSQLSAGSSGTTSATALPPQTAAPGIGQFPQVSRRQPHCHHPINEFRTFNLRSTLLTSKSRPESRKSTPSLEFGNISPATVLGQCDPSQLPGNKERLWQQHTHLSQGKPSSILSSFKTLILRIENFKTPAKCTSSTGAVAIFGPSSVMKNALQP